MAKPSKRAEARKPKEPATAKARAANPTKPRQTRSKPKPVTDTLVWEGLTIAITYEARWFGGSSPQSFSHAHLQVRVTDPADAPLPITETGYRSHFLRDGMVEEAGGAAAYVRRWLDEAARQPSWPRIRDRWRQYSLF
jgi:hypothetical protein